MWSCPRPALAEAMLGGCTSSWEAALCSVHFPGLARGLRSAAPAQRCQEGSLAGTVAVRGCRLSSWAQVTYPAAGASLNPLWSQPEGSRRLWLLSTAEPDKIPTQRLAAYRAWHWHSLSCPLTDHTGPSGGALHSAAPGASGPQLCP